MFFTYLWRELRRRMRQAIFIAVGLAVGIGMVITVNAASSGVKAAQGTVLQNLYGVGTAATVTMPPSANSFGLGGRNFNFKPGATVKIDQLTATRSVGTLNDSAVTTISKLNGVAAAAGAVTASNVDTTFKIPNFNAGGGGTFPRPNRSPGSFRGPGSFNAGNQVTVNGVDLLARVE
jgi:putative ABC transport system permease protein